MCVVARRMGWEGVEARGEAGQTQTKTQRQCDGSRGGSGQREGRACVVERMRLPVFCVWGGRRTGNKKEARGGRRACMGA